MLHWNLTFDPLHFDVARHFINMKWTRKSKLTNLLYPKKYKLLLNHEENYAKKFILIYK